MVYKFSIPSNPGHIYFALCLHRTACVCLLHHTAWRLILCRPSLCISHSERNQWNECVPRRVRSVNGNDNRVMGFVLLVKKGPRGVQINILEFGMETTSHSMIFKRCSEHILTDIIIIVLYVLLGLILLADIVEDWLKSGNLHPLANTTCFHHVFYYHIK